MLFNETVCSRKRILFAVVSLLSVSSSRLVFRNRVFLCLSVRVSWLRVCASAFLEACVRECMRARVHAFGRASP